MSQGIDYQNDPVTRSPVINEQGIEDAFLTKLCGLKYTHRPDITNRAALERNFREKFEALIRQLWRLPCAKRNVNAESETAELAEATRHPRIPMTHPCHPARQVVSATLEWQPAKQHSNRPTP